MREKTNSITHLVKIVAEEVFQEKYYLNPVKIRSMVRQEMDNYLANVRRERVPPGKRSGDLWTDREDNYLRLLFREFCNETATEFKRSTGAIESRIGQKLV